MVPRRSSTVPPSLLEVASSHTLNTPACQIFLVTTAAAERNAKMPSQVLSSSCKILHNYLPHSHHLPNFPLQRSMMPYTAFQSAQHFQGLTLASDIGHLTNKICKCPIDVSYKRTNVLLICYKGGHCPIISSFTRTSSVCVCVCVCVYVCVCVWDLSLTSILCVRYLNYFVYCFLSWH